MGGVVCTIDDGTEHVTYIQSYIKDLRRRQHLGEATVVIALNADPAVDICGMALSSLRGDYPDSTFYRIKLQTKPLQLNRNTPEHVLSNDAPGAERRNFQVRLLFGLRSIERSQKQTSFGVRSGHPATFARGRTSTASRSRCFDPLVWTDIEDDLDDFLLEVSVDKSKEPGFRLSDNTPGAVRCRFTIQGDE